MSDKPREWFAVKRGKNSSYQFYEPNSRNRKTIEAIAPDGGNFEVTCLIEKSAYDALAAENERFRNLIDIKSLVDKFLAWPLPKSVCSDLCVTMSDCNHRVGTNLLTADEARQLFEHLFDEECIR